MKTRNRTILAVAAAIGLWGGTQSFTFAQAKGKQPPPSGGGGSADSGASRNDDSSPPSKSSNSGGGQRAGSGSGGDGGSGGDRAPQPPRQVNRNPPPPPAKRPVTDSQPPPGTTVTPPANIQPPRRAPLGTPPPGGLVPGNNPPPGTYPPGNSANPAPGTYVDRRRQINEQLAQRPIILAPWWYAGNTWPWWYDSYFPNVSFYGNGVDDYSGWDDDTGAGGWHDERYAEGRRERRAADERESTDPGTATPPAAVSGQGAAALSADPVYRQALADAGRLQARYDEASRRVLDELKRNNAQYRQLLERRDRADDRVDAAQASSVQGTDPAKVAPAAQRKLEINSRITQMEQEAIRQDPEASAARRALEEANARVAAMRRAAGVGPTATPAPVTR
jgi:uncharacterized protein YdcH (DUF465 family)